MTFTKKINGGSSMIFPIYLADWYSSKWGNNVGIEALRNDFRLRNGELEGVNIIIGYYDYDNYYGKAFVLYEKEGKLFEVNATHCSCYGLEGSWYPEEVSLVELRNRLENGTYFNFSTDNFKETMKQVVAYLEIRGSN